MPIDFIQQRKKQKYLTVIVIALFIIIAIVLWFGYFKKSESASETILPFSMVEQIEIDFNVLESQFLQESQIFEKIPSFEGEIGRDNPFTPY